MSRIIIILLGLACSVYAETGTFLVLRAEHFPQDRYIYTLSPFEYKKFVDTGKKDIDTASGQPFRLTTYEINYSGKYGLWTVTANNEQEAYDIWSMTNKKYIIPISSSSLVSYYDSRLGGTVTDLVTEHLSDLPTDYFHYESSGTY